MDLMGIRRRLMMGQKRNLGTSDFSLQNVIAYQASSKWQYLDVYLFKTEIPFTILMDCQIVNGYSSDGKIGLDFLSGGDIRAGNFAKGLGIRHFGAYFVNYLFNKGPYIIDKNDYDAHKFVVRYDSTKAKNTKGWIDSMSTESTATFIQSDNPLIIGGDNHSTSTATGYGMINELMIYYRALDDADITNYINNGIIP